MIVFDSAGLLLVEEDKGVVTRFLTLTELMQDLKNELFSTLISFGQNTSSR